MEVGSRIKLGDRQVVPPGSGLSAPEISQQQGQFSQRFVNDSWMVSGFLARRNVQPQ
jgi:hypothetical protein